MVAETTREHLNTARQLIASVRPLVGVGSRAAVEIRDTLAAVDAQIVAALAVMPCGCAGAHCPDCDGVEACREYVQEARGV